MNSNIRLLLPLTKSPRTTLRARVCHYSSDVGEIKIPKRIPRGPTDILKALSSTVGVDPTAAHYKFHDDPYLMPYSNPSKRSYALSQEAGRKAAQWVRQQHADLFQHKVADPIIEAYVPKVEYTDESNVNEELIKSLIGIQQVSDTMTVYEIMKKRGIDVGVETKQSILELVCFYNCQDPFSDEWVEENWFRRSHLSQTTAAQMGKKTWKDDGFAEKLFEEILQNGGDASKAHCTLLGGMLAHGQVDRAWKMYEECKKKGIQLNTIVYNGFLKKATYLRESHELAWQLMVELMGEMHSFKIRPDLITLNSVLHNLELISANRHSRMNAVSTLVEFKQLGVLPSLASYAHLLRIFQRDRNAVSGVLRNILDTLEGDKESMVPKTPEDNIFFLRAMDTISNSLEDKVLAERLDNLLHHATNYSLIGSSFSESIYYRNYFTLMMKTSEIDEFMEFYYKFVPNIYVPELRVLLELLAAIEAQMGWKHIPKMWSDFIVFNQVRTDLVEKLLSLAVEAANEGGDLATAIADVGWSIWEKIESESVKNFEVSGEMLGNILSVLLAGKELSKAHIIMDRIDRLQNRIIGEPAVSNLDKYIDACLEAENIDGALRCIRYCESRNIPETESFANKVTNSGIKLDDSQLRVMNEIKKHF